MKKILLAAVVAAFTFGIVSAPASATTWPGSQFKNYKKKKTAKKSKRRMKKRARRKN